MTQVTTTPSAHESSRTGFPTPAGVKPRVMRPGPEEQDPARFRRRRRRIEIGLAWLAPFVFLLAWEGASRAALVNPQYFPAPSTVWGTLVELIRNGFIPRNLYITLKRVMAGYAMGVLSGGVAGMMMGLSRKVRATLDGLLTALYTVPKLSLLPLLMMIFGLGEAPKIIMIALTSFFFMWMTTMSAFLGISAGYDETARSFGAGRWQRFRHVEFPAALPQIFFGLRLTIGIAMLVVVGVEFVQANSGIGWAIWNAWTLLAASRMYACIMVVAVTGVVLTQAVRVVGKVLLPWSRGGATDATIF